MDIISHNSLPQPARKALESTSTDFDQLVFYTDGTTFFLTNHDEYIAFKWTEHKWVRIAWEHWLSLRAPA